ncbi:hypothetical protein ACQCN2_16650 [Brevibacillus ginsengisoli]|uniref:hypothetical protein n=1 Tax=Brevibacillus ginsengisoli TaxID=363854 RepID=UPI003CF6A356
MQLKSCVSMLSDKTVQAIEAELNRRLPDYSLQEDLPSGDLLNLLGNQNYIHQLWANLHPIEQEAIILFLQQSSKGFIKKKEWESLVQLKNPQLSFGLTGLRRLGLVYTVRKIWSEIGYLMPSEIRRALSKERTAIELVHMFSHQAPHREVLTYYIPSGRGIHLDLFSCILNIHQHDITLTQKRTVHKRSLSKLTSGCSLQSEHIHGWYDHSFPSEVRKAYTGQEALLLDLLLRLGLCRWEGNRLVLDYVEINRFFNLEANKRNEWLVSSLLAAYLPPEPWLEAAMYDILHVEGQDWQPVEIMISRLDRLGYSLPSDAMTRLKDQLLHPLLGCGYLEVGEKNAQLFCRKPQLLLNNQQTADFWYVEPTGMILVSQTVSLLSLWELSQFSSMEFSGEMIHCTLQAAKVQAYVSAGGTEERLLQVLQQGCPYPIPPTVCEQVSKWIKEAKQILFQQVVRVSTAHPNLLEELQGIPILQPFLQEIISSTDFLISLDQQEPFFHLLKQCGFEPSQGTVHHATDLASMNGESAGIEAREDLQIGLFTLLVPWDGYRVENIMPEKPEENPQIRSLPKMWTQHAQSYHPQTLRDIFKRAQELRLQVYLQVASGEEWEGVPERVEVEMGYWMITIEAGRRKLKIRLEDINRIRLILPDYI